MNNQHGQESTLVEAYGKSHFICKGFVIFSLLIDVIQNETLSIPTVSVLMDAPARRATVTRRCQDAGQQHLLPLYKVKVLHKQREGISKSAYFKLPLHFNHDFFFFLNGLTFWFCFYEECMTLNQWWTFFSPLLLQRMKHYFLLPLQWLLRNVAGRELPRYQPFSFLIGCCVVSLII